MVIKKPKKGNLLIAEPSIIGDSSFNRAVILLTNYNADGVVGFILNKPVSYTLDELIPEIEIPIKIYNGGPVEKDNLYFIHIIPNLIPNSIEISNGIYWGGNFNTVIDLILTNKISKNEIKFFLGYSGWDYNQLDNELKENSWIVAENSDKTNLLKKDANAFWKEKMVALGGEYSLWSNAPENPMYN